MEADMVILAQKINETCNWIQKSFEDIDDVPPHISKHLAYPAARLANILLPFQKLSETIYASKNQLTINTHQQGHDLEDVTGRRIEHKSSKASKITTIDKNNATIKKKNRRHCNVNWVFPSIKLSHIEREKQLIDSIDEKTNNGYMVVEVKNGLDKPIQIYNLSNTFLKEYFMRIYKNKERINLGCDQCDTCGHFHRIKKLHDASKNLKDNPHMDIDILFKKYDIFGRVTSQCTSE